MMDESGREEIICGSYGRSLNASEDVDELAGNLKAYYLAFCPLSGIKNVLFYSPLPMQSPPSFGPQF